MLSKILMGKSHPCIIIIWKAAFFIPSLVYRFVLSLDQGIRKSRRKALAPYHKKTTISIGNITMGGAGKTMLGLSLAGYLAGEGMKVGVVLRGYKGKLEKKKSVCLEEDNKCEAGDEAQLYYEVLKNSGGIVMVGKRKELSWKTAQKTADIILLDDGFQRLEIPRDKDYLCFDADVGTGNGSLFPAGYLRQPTAHAAGADAWFIKTHNQAGKSSFSLNEKSVPHTYFFAPEPYGIENLEGEQKPVSFLESQTVLCFCAIGNPDSFFSLVKEKIPPGKVYFQVFPDHQDYPVSFLNRLEKQYSHCTLLLCTPKDFVKIRSVEKRISQKLKKKLYFLGIDIKIYSKDFQKIPWRQIIGYFGKYLDKRENHAI